MRRTLSIAAVIAAAATSAAGGPPVPPNPPKYDLRQPDRYQAGDVFTTDAQVDASVVNKITAADGTVIQDTTNVSKLTFVTVTKCLEADAAGRMTHSIAYVKAFGLVRNELALDDSLTGAFLEVTGTGAARTYKLLGDSVTPSEIAKPMLDALGGGTADPDVAERASRPKAAVAVGESFSIDAPAYTKANFATVLPIDADKATGKGTLTEVSGKTAKLRFEVTVPLKGLPLAPGAPPVPFEAGAKISSTWDETRALEGRIRLALQVSKTSTGGVAATPDGTKVEIQIASSQTAAVTVGGEMPPIPAAPK
jgi:hypothetical protein